MYEHEDKADNYKHFKSPPPYYVLINLPSSPIITINHFHVKVYVRLRKNLVNLKIQDRLKGNINKEY